MQTYANLCKFLYNSFTYFCQLFDNLFNETETRKMHKTIILLKNTRGEFHRNFHAGVGECRCGRITGECRSSVIGPLDDQPSSSHDIAEAPPALDSCFCKEIVAAIEKWRECVCERENSIHT